MKTDDELMALEAELTIYELLVLFKVATGLDIAMGPWEPIWSLASEESSLCAAPFLSESALLELARQQRMVRLGLIMLCPGEGCGIRLRPKGWEAVKWWGGALKDLGFVHRELEAN